MKSLLKLFAMLLFNLSMVAQTVTIGTGTDVNEGIPIDPYYYFSYSQNMYHKDSIGMPMNIAAIRFYYNGNSAWSQELSIYMAEISRDSFASATDWVSYDSLKLVFSDTLYVTATAGWVEIILDSIFPYTHTGNLVVAVYDNDPTFSLDADAFYNSLNGSTKYTTLYINSGSTISIMAPNSGYNRTRLPNIQLVNKQTTLPYIIFAGDTLWVHPVDNSTSIRWGAYLRDITAGNGASSDSNGYANTKAIVAEIDSGAAYLCDTLSAFGYTNWYLPSKAELNALWLDTAVIGGFAPLDYWSSTEADAMDAWDQTFYDGVQGVDLYKDNFYRVRCVRRSEHFNDLKISLNFIIQESYIDACNGEISITPKGCSGYYQYVWSNSQTTNALNNLCPGTYTVTVTDSFSLKTVSDTFIINSATSLPFVVLAGDTLWVHPVDNSNGIPWYNGVNINTGALSDTNGKANTDSIVHYQGSGYYAAYLCDTLNAYGYSNWYLPAKAELHALWLDTAKIGGFNINYYWSSTEFDSSQAWCQHLGMGAQVKSGKTSGNQVRCVRRTEPYAPLALALDSVRHESVPSACDAYLAISVSGGSGYFTYLWNNSSTNSTLSPLCPGTYSVTVTDTVTMKTIIDSFNILNSLENGLVAYYPFNGNANDYSIYSNNAVIYGLNKFESSIVDTGILFRSSMGDYAIAPSHPEIDSLNKISISCWVKISSFDLGAWANSEAIINKGWGDSPVNRYALVAFRNSNPIDASATSYDSIQFVMVYGDSNFYTPFYDKNQWFHIVAMVGNGNYEIYVNGQKVSEGSTANRDMINNKSLEFNYHTWAGGSSSSKRLGGILDEVRIYNRLLNQYEIDSLYHEGGWPITPSSNFTFTADSATRQVTFTNTSLAGDNFYWDFDDGNTSQSANPVKTYDKAGSYNVCLSAKNNSTGMVDISCKTVSIALPANTVTAGFSYTISDSVNHVVALTNSSSNYTSLLWTFGDGSYQQGSVTSHQYLKTGKYSLCLTAYDNTGKSNKYCQEVTIPSSCNISSGFSVFVDSASNTLFTSNTSTGNVNNYFWNFGDGAGSRLKSPKHTYSKVGIYLVSLSVRDTLNNCVDYSTKVVQVGNIDCKANFDYTVKDVGALSVDFSNLSRGNVDNYQWDFGNGASSTEQSPAVTYAEAGTYQASLTVTDIGGYCMDKAAKDISIGKVKCEASFGYYVDSLSNKAYFTNNSKGAITDYYWLFGDGKVSTLENPVHTFASSGYFTVRLMVYNDTNYCISQAEEKGILISAQEQDCEADFLYLYNVQTDSVIFTNASRGNANNYIWNFGDKNVKYTGNNRHVHRFANAGVYNVCLTALCNSVNNLTCKPIRIEKENKKPLKAQFQFILTGNRIILKNKSEGTYDKVMWYFGDGDSNSTAEPTHDYLTNNWFKVKLKISSTLTGEISEAYGIADLSSTNGLIATYEARMSKPAKATGYPVDFVAITHGDAAKLKWDFGDGSTDSTTTTPTHEYKDPGTYIACLTISDPIIGESDTWCDTIIIAAPADTSEQQQVGELAALPEVPVRLYPNPASNYITIEYKVESRASVDIALFSNTGKLVETLVHTEKTPDTYQLMYDVRNLSGGVYALRVMIGGGVYRLGLVVE